MELCFHTRQNRSFPTTSVCIWYKSKGLNMELPSGGRGRSVMTIRATCFLIKGKWSPGAALVPGARTWEVGTCTGANLGKKWTVSPNFAFTERIESDTVGKTLWFQINFYHLTPTHTARILHLILNVHSMNSTNTDKELLTPRLLGFPVGNSLIPAFLFLVLMTLTLESEPTAVLDFCPPVLLLSS